MYSQSLLKLNGVVLGVSPPEAVDILGLSMVPPELLELRSPELRTQRAINRLLGPAPSTHGPA